MKAASFDYVAPRTVDEAVEVLAAHEDAKLLAGGQSLVPMMAMRLAQPPIVVDLSGVDALRGISDDGDGAVRIGAMTTQTDLLDSADLARQQPLVAEVVPYVAHEAIRNRGTVGGSLAHADPAAEWPALTVLLGAHIDVLGPGGPRAIAAEDFFQGVFMTALAPDELVTAVRLPAMAPRLGWGVTEVARRTGDFALAGALALVETDGGTIASCRIVLLSLAGVPLRLTGLEEALTSAALDDVPTIVGQTLPGASAYSDDIHASAEFRAHLARVVTRRAVATAARRSQEGGS